MNLRGFPVRLIDTAGLRSAADEIEREGIARTEKSLQQADLRLRVVDASAGRPSVINSDDNLAAELLVLNKTDLSEHPDWAAVEGQRVSCLTGEGITELEQVIIAKITQGHLQSDNSVAINIRHRDCLRRALTACEHTSGSLGQGVSPEYIAVDLNEALQALGEIIGSIDVERVLDSVFGQFCIGK